MARHLIGMITAHDSNKDRQGKLVQKVSFDGATRFATCYVYDDLARLRFVIPPLAAADNLVSPGEPDLLCFQYRYDTRGRMVKKKIPGADRRALKKYPLLK